MFSPIRARARALYRAFVAGQPAEHIADALSSLDKGAPLLGDCEFVARHAPNRRSAQSLESLIDTACRHFGVTPAALRSPSRQGKLVAARAWVASAALRLGVASLAAVARALNRDESTLRHAMRSKQDQQNDDAPRLDLLTTEEGSD